MFFLLLLLSIPIFLFYHYYWKLRHLPPGPTPTPFLGNLLELSRENRWETKFVEWSKQYGPTFTYWLGAQPIVAISDYNDLNKYFVKQAEVFSDRFNRHINEFRGGEYGIILKNGDPWREQRRFALKVLRDFGLGKNQMEERILVELDDLLAKANKVAGSGEVQFSQYTDMAVGSIINSIINGNRYTEENAEEFELMKSSITKLFLLSRDNRVLFAAHTLPFILVPILGRKALETRHYLDRITDYLNNQVKEHLASTVYTQTFEPKDFIDAYLLEREERLRHGEDDQNFGIDQLKYVIFDLWVAGQETTSSTVTWVIGYLIRHPEVQEKLQEELDSVIGSKRIIRNADRPNLPYTNAIIMETLRCSVAVSEGILREVNEDVMVSGYMLKKGTVIVPQISVVLRNEKFFPEPERFNPDRFIDENGKLKHVEELIPFSLGKRICLGEGMARMELFIFTANLFNQYKFSAGKVPPTLRKLTGSAAMVEPYKCVIETR